MTESEFERDTEVSRYIEQHRRRAILAQRLLVTTAAILAIVMIAAVGYDIRVGNKTRERIEDCTVPGGECYQHSAERSAKAIQTLIAQGQKRAEVTRVVVVLAAYCAQEKKTLRAIQKCVESKLEE